MRCAFTVLCSLSNPDLVPSLSEFEKAAPAERAKALFNYIVKKTNSVLAIGPLEYCATAKRTVLIRPYRRGVWGVTPYLRSGGAAAPNVMRYGRRRRPKICYIRQFSALFWPPWRARRAAGGGGPARYALRRANTGGSEASVMRYAPLWSDQYSIPWA